MTYLVHINPTPGSDLRVVEVEGDDCNVEMSGALSILGKRPAEDEGRPTLAAFSPAVWNYVEPKK